MKTGWSKSSSFNEPVCWMLWRALLSINTKMVITCPANHWLYGHHGTDEGGYTCKCICVHLRETCMYACHVLDDVSNGTGGTFMYVCIYVCAHLYLWVFLLVCTLYPWAVMNPFLIRTIIVGLSPGSTSWPLTLVKFCQVNFLCICWNNRVLSASRQQALKFLKNYNRV